jgi:hypothetical protein
MTDMKKKKVWKRVIAAGCVLAMTAGLLTGCGSNQKSTADRGEVLVLSGHEISESELMVYSLLELLNGEQYYSDVAADEASFKEATIEYARETKVLYDVALQEGIEFSDSDVETRDQLMQSFISYFPDEVFETYGITEDVIEQVFIEKSYVEKLDNDKRNEMGQALTDEYEAQYQDYNFQTLYYIVFPAVEADENNEPVVDDDGNYVTLSDEEKETVKANAEAAAEAINQGQDAEEVAEQYGVSDYCSEQSGYVGAYSDEMNEILSNMTAGQCSPVYESSMSYYMIAVLTDHDSDLLLDYAYNLALNDVDDQYAAQRQAWMDAVATDTDADLTEGFWADFSLLDMATDLNQRGLMN